jgi:hypothetical protein
MISPKVKEELLEAQSHLKNALSYAARNETSLVLKTIADLICTIESIEKFDALMDNLESRQPGDSGRFGTFFS